MQLFYVATPTKSSFGRWVLDESECEMKKQFLRTNRLLSLKSDYLIQAKRKQYIHEMLGQLKGV